MSGRAASVTIRMARDGPKTPAWPDCRRAYFLQTLADFKSGARKSADPGKGNTNLMANIAKAMTDDELKAAAAYFGSMKWTPWIKVVEADVVPKTRVQGGMFLKLEGSETEPIGRRIVETPDDAERTEVLRDPRSAFTAYVPKGSIKQGEGLVKTGGNGKTTQCTVCHGTDLKGLGPVPGLAGRSPSYTARQLYDMQQKARGGTWTELMMPVVSQADQRRHPGDRGVHGLARTVEVALRSGTVLRSAFSVRRFFVRGSSRERRERRT